MTKLFDPFFLSFFVVISSSLSAGEAEKKISTSALQPLRVKLMWDIAAHSTVQADVAPFCHERIITSIKDFQDTCFSQLQNLYKEWVVQQRWLQERYKEYDILKKDNNPSFCMAEALIFSGELRQDSCLHVYYKIAQVYRILCAYDATPKAIDPQLLTLDKFPDLGRSLVTPSLCKKVIASFAVQSRCRSSSV